MISHPEYIKRVTEINRLRNEIHLFNNEEISESALDQLKHSITEYENSHPELISPNSPNYTVAGGVLEGFSKFTHTRRVLSLGDLFSLKEVQDWGKKWKDYLFSIQGDPDTQQYLKSMNPQNDSLISQDSITEKKRVFAEAIREQYIVEPKLDGMAIVLHYKNGELAKAVTRGDSRVGEDVTANIRLISEIPKTIPDTSDIEIRGELIMSIHDFLQLNTQIAEGKKQGKLGKTGAEAVFANPRNAVAGTIRNLDQSIITERPMHFIAYGLYKE